MLLGSAWHLAAQQELMLLQSPKLWHSNSLNPAMVPSGEKSIFIGLPAFSLDAAHSGDISYNDLLKRSDGATVIDLSQAISDLDEQNQANFDIRTETLNFGIRIGDYTVQGGHAFRLNGILDYPKTLAELIWNGNAPYIGETVEFAPALHYADWNEWSVGVSKKFTHFSVGARVKYLTGISSVETDESRRAASIYTDPDIYQLTMNTNYMFRSSSVISVIDTSDLGFSIDLYDFDRKVFTTNSGFAVDLGVSINFTEELTVNASVLDIGASIKWKERAYEYLSNGTYQYNGTYFPGVDLITGADSLDFTTKLDTLNDIFNFTRTTAEFTTKLPLRFYVGGWYKPSNTWRFGLSVFHQRTEARQTTAVGGSAHWMPLNWLELGAMYSVNDRSAANFGFQLSVTPGPVQIYLVSDNLLNIFNLRNSAAANLRFGGSLAF